MSEFDGPDLPGDQHDDNSDHAHHDVAILAEFGGGSQCLVVHANVMKR